MTEDSDLEDVVRNSLQGRAERADVTAPVLDEVRADVRHRARGRAAGGLVAALVAIAVAGFIVAGVGRDMRGGAVDRGGEAVDTSGWRTEYWHGVQVDVPGDWGWGVAPLTGGALAGVVCGSQNGSYVGRPVLQTDDCGGAKVDARPEAPYIWLGADLPAGLVDLGGGWLRETREVAGATVSVAALDSAFRDAVLASARAGKLCRPRLAEPPSVESMLIEGMGVPTSMRVCVYEGDGTAGYDLVYANNLGARAANDYVDATGRAPRAVTGKSCDAQSPYSGSYVLLTLTGDDPFGTAPVQQDNMVDLNCFRTEVSPLAPRRYVLTTEDAVAAWASGGVAKVVHASGSGAPDGAPPWLYDYFIGPQG